MGLRSRSMATRSAGGSIYNYDDQADEEDEQLEEEEDIDELDDEEDEYGDFNRMSRGRVRSDSRSRSRSRSLSRTRSQALALALARRQNSYGRGGQYGREVMEPGGYDEVEEEEEMLSERARGGVGMYSPRYQPHRYGLSRHRFPSQRMLSPFPTPRFARDDLALYQQAEMPYEQFLPSPYRGGYQAGYAEYIPRKYYDDLDMAPWGGSFVGRPTYWAGATMAVRRMLPPLPGPSPNIVYPTPRGFAIILGSLAGTSGPWFSIVDAMDHHRVLFATGACTSGISVISIGTESVGEILRLTSCRTGRSVNCADVRIVVTNYHAVPLLTAVVPAVTESCERSMYHSGMYAGAYGAGVYGGMHPAAAAAAAASSSRSYSTAGMSPYGGVGWPGRTGYEMEGRHPYSMTSEYGFGDSGMGAVFYAGDRGHEGPSVHRRRKRTLPVMRLVRSPDGTREWIQNGVGIEMASILYATQPGTPAPFSVEGTRATLYLQPNVDIALIAAALIARLWIYVETGVGQ